MTIDNTRVAFLSELSGRHPRLLVWKHLDRALRGRGDVDAAAPARDVAPISANATEIAADVLGASHVISCDHVADKYLQFFVQPERLPQLFEFDICSQPSRGLAPWASPTAMLPLATVRADGIRSLRPGAEALVSLVYHGISWRGQDKLIDDELQIVRNGLTGDLAGVYDACEKLLPVPAKAPLRALVDGLRRGVWSKSHAQQAFSGFVLSGLVRPAHTTRRMLFRARLASGGDCVMGSLARISGRQVCADDVQRFLDTARAGGHDVRAL